MFILPDGGLEDESGSEWRGWSLIRFEVPGLEGSCQLVVLRCAL
jgi:hypothetical protein